MNSLLAEQDLPFSIDVAILDEAWTSLVPDWAVLVDAAVRAVWKILQDPRAGELSLALVNDETIQALNKNFRGKDKPTNVLSFPMEDPAHTILGDIIIARETVALEAADKQVAVKDHVSHLIIHGFLHLQGYDHETAYEAEIMEALEINALQLLNIDNPYEIHEQ